jgi:hypothetical protein
MKAKWNRFNLNKFDEKYLKIIIDHQMCEVGGVKLAAWRLSVVKLAANRSGGVKFAAWRPSGPRREVGGLAA